MITAKNFDISDVLSITNGALVSTRHIEGVYDILNFMTGDNLMTHALPRAMEACKPALLKQFPALAKDSQATIGPDNWKPWLAKMRIKHGDVFAVTPLESYESLHPLAEPILAGKKVITI